MMADTKRQVPNLRFKGFTDDWEQRKLGEVFLYKQGIQVPVEQQYSQKLPGLIRFIRISDIVSSNEPPRFINYHGTNLINPDDLFMVRYGNPGMISMGYSGVIANNLFRLIPKKNIYTLFFYFLLIFENKRLNLLVSNTTMPALSFKALDTFYVNFPEKLSEQKVIGSLLKKLDSLITLQQRKLDLLKQLKKGFLQKMFADKSKFPILRFEGFHDEWEQRKLGEAAEIIGGGTPSTQISNYWNGDINWYTPAEISNFIYTRKSKRKISMEGLENSSARLLPVGTVLFTSRAGIGKTAILSKEGTTNQGFQSIVPNKKLLDSYFIFSLTNELKKYGETHGAGSTFIEISGRELAKAPLKLPALKEQKKIGGLLHQVDELISLQQQKLAKYQSIKKSLLQQMFM